MITPYSYGPTTEEIEAVAASVELTKEELYELEAEQFSLQDISTTSSGRKKRARKLSTGSNSSNGQSSDSETDNVQWVKISFLKKFPFLVGKSKINGDFEIRVQI